MDGLGSLSVRTSVLAIPRIWIPEVLNDHFVLEMDLNAFIRTADPRKVMIVERARAKNERPIVTGAKHHTVTLLSTFVVHSSGELSASVEREFVGDASVGDGRDQGFDFIAGQDNVDLTVPVTEANRVSSSSYLTLITSSVDSAKSADPEVDSLVRSAAPVMTEATTVAIVATTVAIPADFSKDKSAPHPSVFGSSSSYEKTDRTLSLFTGSSGSGFDAGSIRAEEAVGAGSEEIYIVCGMKHEQLFTEFNVSAARNLSLSSEVRMRAEYNILEKRKWRSLAEEKNILLEAKDKEIEDLKSQLLKAKEESAELKVTGLESTTAEKDHELFYLGASSSSLKSHNQSLVNQIFFATYREKLEMYEGILKQLEEFQDNLMGPLRTRLAEIDADFTRCCMRFQENFHPHLLNVVAGRRWLLTHGMKLLQDGSRAIISQDRVVIGKPKPCLLLWIFAYGRVEKMEGILLNRESTKPPRFRKVEGKIDASARGGLTFS
ncbi:hypothetical protein Tco_0953405 [Tanacetum coccineum]|uniref:Uncharacterized protein n=1 Tax=Tanacetum coccineum TaxID=301880 RepID=A0ABQ5DZS6_9ASTR